MLDADIRIIVKQDDQSIGFVAADIAKVLGYQDAKHLIRGLDDDEQSLQKVERLNGQGAVDTSVITELSQADLEQSPGVPWGYTVKPAFRLAFFFDLQFKFYLLPYLLVKDKKYPYHIN